MNISFYIFLIAWLLICTDFVPSLHGNHQAGKKDFGEIKKSKDIVNRIFMLELCISLFFCMCVCRLYLYIVVHGRVYDY